MNIRFFVYIFAVLLIMPVMSIAQDDEAPQKQDQTEEQTKKENEAKTFAELQGLVKKTLGSKQTSEERNELFEKIERLSYEYYKTYAWMNSKNTINAIMFRVSVLSYKNKREELLAFTEELLADEKLPENVSTQIFQERVKLLQILDKYDVLLKELEAHIKDLKEPTSDMEKIDLLSYQHLKLICCFKLKKDVKEFIQETSKNLESIEHESYKFEVTLVLVKTTMIYEKYEYAKTFLQSRIADYENAKEKDNDVHYRCVQSLFYLGKIMVLEGEAKEELEKIKTRMQEVIELITSYRMRTPANNLYKELNSFIRFRVGMTAPAWTLKSVADDKEYSLVDFEGKTVVICFWASWNAYSRRIMKDYLIKWNKDFADKNVVIINIGINRHGDTALKQKEFAQDLKYNWLFLFDEGNTVSEAYGVTEVPQTVIIGTDGKVKMLGNELQKMDEYLKEITQDNTEQNQTKPGK